MKKKTLKEESIRSMIRNVIQETLLEDSTFDFESYEGTALDGASVEMAIDNLIAQFQKDLNKVLAVDTAMKSKARIAIKQMIVNKLKQWNR